jgi:hypothetical protein
LILLQRGSSKSLVEANNMIARRGMLFRLSDAVLRPSVQESAAGSPDDDSRLALIGPSKLRVVDAALPAELFFSLQQAFMFPQSPFWTELGYETKGTGYFSFVEPLKPTQLTAEDDPSVVVGSLITQTAHRILDIASILFPSLIRGESTGDTYRREATGGEEGGEEENAASLAASSASSSAMVAGDAEWWVHWKPHHAGTPLHFDSVMGDDDDDDASGIVRTPILSTVLYLSDEGVGGPTLVTDQALNPDPQAGATAAKEDGNCFGSDQGTGTGIHDDGHAGRQEKEASLGVARLVFPAPNRLLLFQGDLMHGVAPAPGVAPLILGGASSLRTSSLPPRESGDSNAADSSPSLPSSLSPTSSMSARSQRRDTQIQEEVDGTREKGNAAKEFQEREKNEALDVARAENGVGENNEPNAKLPINNQVVRHGRTTLMVALWRKMEPRAPPSPLQLAGGMPYPKPGSGFTWPQLLSTSPQPSHPSSFSAAETSATSSSSSSAITATPSSSSAAALEPATALAPAAYSASTTKREAFGFHEVPVSASPLVCPLWVSVCSQVSQTETSSRRGGAAIVTESATPLKGDHEPEPAEKRPRVLMLDGQVDLPNASNTFQGITDWRC